MSADFTTGTANVKRRHENGIINHYLLDTF